jgi:hypothetical protein
MRESMPTENHLMKLNRWRIAESRHYRRESRFTAAKKSAHRVSIASRAYAARHREG